MNKQTHRSAQKCIKSQAFPPYNPNTRSIIFSMDQYQSICVYVVCPLVAVVTTCYLLGFVRVGTRRSMKPLVDISKDLPSTASVRETGLIQQWYTDQPCQRIYALAISAKWSIDGIQALKDTSRVRQAVLSLVKRHQSLASTLFRDAKTNRAYMVNHEFNHIEASLGPIPISWHSRKNVGTWRDCLQALTHTEMNESSWLFRIGIVVSDSDDVTKMDPQAEIIVATHHVITDGMSNASLLTDLLHFLGTDNPTILPPLPLVFMDEKIDMRPPLGTVLEVVGEDALPASLRQQPIFYQGPLPIPTTPSEIEGHVATIHLPPALFRRLVSLAKAHRVSLHGLISAVLLFVEAAHTQNHTTKTSDVSSSMKLKFAFPMGKAVRHLAKVSNEQVGLFITAKDLILDIPTTTTGLHHDLTFWSIAKQLTHEARESPRHSLDMLGLINFLPRDSITPWFLKEGARYTLQRDGSLEVSNLGAVEGLNRLIHQEKTVKALFASPSSEEERVHTEVYLCQGRGYRGAVFVAGVATCQEHLTIAINCQWGQCGCTESMRTRPHAYEEAASIRQSTTHRSTAGYMLCACPKDEFLYQYTEKALIAFASIVL
jgi:hypothetical protein